ncbi:MAG: ABC transporter permease, partial [Acidobacteriota bacterium]
MLDTIRQDARYTIRLLKKSPLFTVTAALSLAIGIGANATIFSVVNALLLRPLPGLARPEQLVDVGRTQDGHGFDTVSYPNYADLRERATTLAGIYAYNVGPQPMSLATSGEAERVYGGVVTPNYFGVLGTKPAAGRLFTEADGHDVPHAVAVLSHELWQRRFAGSPGIVGQTISLNGQPFMVVGVAPAGFHGTTLLKSDLWVPISMVREAMPHLGKDAMNQRGAVWLFMGARLKEGVSTARANAELQAIGAALEREHPAENRGKNFTVAKSEIFPGETSAIAGFLGFLMVIVGLVLLVACVNVAGMLLARSVARRREIAVRLAIGAGRSRLVRQLLTETAILFAIGGTAGILLTQWLTMLLLGVLPEIPVPIGVRIETDWRVVGFGVVLSLGAALLSGLAPALQASRADLVPALKTERLDGGLSRLRLRNAFVVAQVTMSLVLVIVGGLFLRALQHAAEISPGFNVSRVDVVSIDLSLAGYGAETAAPFMRELLARTRTLPGVESASAAVDLPLDGGRMGMGGLTVPGKRPPVGDAFDPDWNVSAPGLFRTLELALLRGRDFTEADTAASTPVAIINQALATQIWPGEDPIGRQMVMSAPDSQGTTLTVVGVAADARVISLTGPVAPYIYVPLAQHYLSRVAIFIRTTDGRSSIPQVRGLIRSLNPGLPISEAMTLADVTAVGLVPQRVAAALAGSLGLVGLLLAAIGIHGVTSYAVSRRTREIGIRIALGADRVTVVRLVLGQGLALAGMG